MKSDHGYDKKFNFEGYLNLYSDEPKFFKLADLRTVRKEFYDEFIGHHIYMIAKVPRIWFSPIQIVDATQGLHLFSFNIQSGYSYHSHEFICTLPKQTRTVEVSPFPHDVVFCKDCHGGLVDRLNSLHFMLNLPETIKPHLEVLYVGRSYGSKYRLNVLDRLSDQKHDNLLDILINSASKEPDTELVVLTYNFKYEGRYISMDGTKPGSDHSFDIEMKRIDYLKSLRISNKLKIDIIEEGMINYFDPPFNKYLRHSMPKVSSSTIKAFQSLDVGGVIVEFYSKEHGLKLTSQRVSPRKLHFIPFGTFKDKNRFHFHSPDELDSYKENRDHLLDLI